MFTYFKKKSNDKNLCIYFLQVGGVDTRKQGTGLKIKKIETALDWLSFTSMYQSGFATQCLTDADISKADNDCMKEMIYLTTIASQLKTSTKVSFMVRNRTRIRL